MLAKKLPILNSPSNEPALKAAPKQEQVSLYATYRPQPVRQEKSHEHIHEDKALRKGLSEHQIDGMINDSFPASDPPSTY